MLIRALALAAPLAYFAIATHDPTLGLLESPGLSVVGLAGLGLVTLRSEKMRQAPRRG